MSWVMNSTVRCRLSRSSCSTFSTLTRNDASSIDVASSASSTFGFIISARAIITRCR